MGGGYVIDADTARNLGGSRAVYGSGGRKYFGRTATEAEASPIIKSIGSTNCFPGDMLRATEQRRLPDAHGTHSLDG
jgi:hypothetical protein